ncbi:MAG TPA: L,D-transpeptidase [Anaerolineales bacterium]|jgi:lipoprotein-anchoring transpeptidase ErfK/SrfK|nr:L,D-transpeptidase [Anaerolineales bacterium]HNQ95083.1 L,D-transpeptidase [Anaerolineales bacterium]HNS61559.1 L,D-transpeptidase [Anaerolineales bacterium]
MTKTRRLFLPVLLILSLGGISLAYFFFTPSPADAFLNAPTPAATQENLWAHVEIAKPTHTPVILPTETPTQIPIATETPALLAMEIVNEISVALEQAEQIEADPPAAPISGGSKYILVDISDQHMYVYENDALIYSFVASTGINNATRVGVFAVQSKFDNAYGATWDIWMPNWLGIYWAGGLENGIHALPILPNGATLWEGFLGRPVSYGCVVLGTYESKLLYDWAEMGTTVEIQW